MKKLFVLITACLLLSGCSNSEYDKLQTDYNNLSANYNETKEKYDKLVDSNKETADALVETTTKYMDLLAESGDIVVGAWGTAAFGDNTEYSMLNKSTVQYKAILNGVSKDSIHDLLQEFSDNVGTLKIVASQKELTNIYIKIVDSNSSPILELFVDLSDSDNPKTDMLTNTTYNDIIAEALDEL